MQRGFHFILLFAILPLFFLFRSKSSFWKAQGLSKCDRFLESVSSRPPLFRSWFVTEAQRRVEPSFSRLFHCSLNSCWRIQVRPASTLHRLEVRTPLSRKPRARTKPLKSRGVMYHYPLEIYFHSCFSSICNMTVKLMRTEIIFAQQGLQNRERDMRRDENIKRGY